MDTGKAIAALITQPEVRCALSALSAPALFAPIVYPDCGIVCNHVEGKPPFDVPQGLLHYMEVVGKGQPITNRPVRLAPARETRRIAPLPFKPSLFLHTHRARSPCQVPFIAIPTTAGTGSEARERSRVAPQLTGVPQLHGVNTPGISLACTLTGTRDSICRSRRTACSTPLSRTSRRPSVRT